MLEGIKKYLTNKTIVHAAMLAFAVTSTLNIANFFLATGHHLLVAASIGLALGAGLMAVSIYLSNQDINNRFNFFMLLGATVCMALLSGQIQTMGYMLHGLESFTSYLLGYAPPIVVEIMLALSVSLAEKAERERVQRDSKRFIKDSVAEAMTAAFRAIDASRIQKHIEKQTDMVIKSFVDSALSEMLDELRHDTAKSGTVASVTLPQINAQMDAATLGESTAEASNLPTHDTLLDVGREKAHAQQRTARAQRQNQLLQILLTEFNGAPSDDLNKTAIAERLGSSRQTISRDIEELIAAQRLSVNGHIEVLAN